VTEVLQVAVGGHAAAAVLLQAREQFCGIDTGDHRAVGRQRLGDRCQLGAPPPVAGHEQRKVFHFARGAKNLDVLEASVREGIRTGCIAGAQGSDEREGCDGGSSAHYGEPPRDCAQSATNWNSTSMFRSASLRAMRLLRVKVALATGDSSMSSETSPPSSCSRRRQSRWRASCASCCVRYVSSGMLVEPKSWDGRGADQYE